MLCDTTWAAYAARKNLCVEIALMISALVLVVCCSSKPALAHAKLLCNSWTSAHTIRTLSRASHLDN